MDIRYFDNAATTKVKEEVLEEMFPYLSLEYGNPSSIYGLGRRAKKAIEEARKRVASLLNCKSNEIIFTSCGSESDNMALKGMAMKQKYENTGKNHLITSKIEHPAILNSCHTLEKQGFDVTYLDVDKDGMVNLDTLLNNISDKTFLISVMFANNEIGTIEPIEKISKIAKAHNIVFHTDAVQAVGNVPIDVRELDIDMLSLSGHKLYAPKGIGALYVKEGLDLAKFLDGGHQERDKRAGTENVAEIVALGKACKLVGDDLEIYAGKLQRLRDYFLEQVRQKFPTCHINGSLEHRLPGNCNLCFENVNSGELLLKLDAVGICASGGSACSSGNENPSHVLSAIGVLPELSRGALRVTFGDFNTIDDVDFLLKSLEEILVNEQINRKP